MHRAAWSGAFLVLAMISTGCSNGGGDACEGDAPTPTWNCCEGTWVDPINDTRNCGSCGYTCSAGQYCLIGACEGTVTPDGGPPRDGGDPGMCRPSCSSSQRCCGTSCIGRSGVAIGADGRSDPTFSNCTACGAACDPERASACSVPGAGGGTPRCMCGSEDACGAGRTCALTGTSFACVNLQTDPTNCGTVGNACTDREDCVAGVCTPRMCGSVVCTETQTCCGTTCSDTQTDVMNCGACGNVCQAGESCTAGMCRCGEDVCARPMPPPFPGLPGGTCGEICCAGACVASDPSNCGGCGVACTGVDECGQAGAIGAPPGPVGCMNPDDVPIFSIFSECPAVPVPDAGMPDAGTPDAGTPDLDAGVDAGPPPAP